MKIVFTGPESSGKTGVSKAVAEQLSGKWHPEYARKYLLQKDGEYCFEDIEKIALAQEQERAQFSKNALQIYDTGSIVLYIWSLFKYAKCAPTIQNQVNNQNIDLYFLCSPEGIPWEDDPLREHPNERNELFALYHKTLLELDANFIVLKGNEEMRIKTAVKAITKQIKC